MCRLLLLHIDVNRRKIESFSKIVLYKAACIFAFRAGIRID